MIWNGTDDNDIQVGSGIYFAVLKNENRVICSKKITMMK